MASTNKTTNYNLSQFIGSDKPTYLGDYNSDMLKIDAQMKTNADNVATAMSGIETATATANSANQTAQTANTTANSASATASEANTNASNAQSTANSALATATTAQSTANAVNTNVGDLSNLDTTDKTSIVNAINEVVESDFIYSSTEIKTDMKWINNKPIYRKVLNIGARSFTQGNNNIIHDISNIDKVINVEFELCMNNSWYHTWDNILNVIIRSNEFNVYANAPFTADDCYVLIEYTKSTD